MTAEQLAHTIQEEQGFVIVWSADLEYKRGDVIEAISAWPLASRCEGPMVVIDTATHEEYLKQTERFLPRYEARAPAVFHYYKVKAE